jgi:hypothetical protein
VREIRGFDPDAGACGTDRKQDGIEDLVIAACGVGAQDADRDVAGG